MGNTGTDVCLAGSDHWEISGATRKNEMYPVVTADEHLKEFYTEDASLPGKSGNALFIFLMTEQTETTEIK